MTFDEIIDRLRDDGLEAIRNGMLVAPRLAVLGASRAGEPPEWYTIDADGEGPSDELRENLRRGAQAYIWFAELEGHSAEGDCMPVFFQSLFLIAQERGKKTRCWMFDSKGNGDDGEKDANDVQSDWKDLLPTVQEGRVVGRLRERDLGD